MSMEFWGVEVKSGEPLRVDPGEEMIVHISQVALGKNKNDVNEPVWLYIEVGDQKLMIGKLSHDKFPQMSTEIVLEKSFKLSHSWKDGSVYFTGYRVDVHDSDSESDDDEVAGLPVAKSGAKQVNFQLPNEDAKAEEDEDDSEDESEDDSEDEEEEKKVTAEVAEVDDDDDDEDDSSDDEEDDSSDEETPEKKVEDSKKRSAEANTSKTASNKKAKFVTPQKSETKKPHVHVATPHPSKQGGKNSASNGESSKQQQTPKSAGAFGCSSCNRTFTSEMGLQSHTKAKHSAAA